MLHKTPKNIFLYKLLKQECVSRDIAMAALVSLIWRKMRVQILADFRIFFVQLIFFNMKDKVYVYYSLFILFM